MQEKRRAAAVNAAPTPITEPLVMPRRRTVALLSALLIAPATLVAQASTDVRALGPARVGAQVAAGTAATPVGFVAGGLAARSVARAFGAAEDDASRVANVGAGAGIVLATAGSAALIGARGPGSGSFPAAVGGAAVGTGLSGLLILLNRRPDDDAGRPCRLTCVLATAAIVTLPSIGATIGYDVSRKR